MDASVAAAAAADRGVQGVSRHFCADISWTAYNGLWAMEDGMHWLFVIVLYMYCLSGCKVTPSWPESLIIVLGRTTALRSS